MRAASGLAQPPDDVEALRAIPRATAPPVLHRLSNWPGAWWFSSIGHDGDTGNKNKTNKDNAGGRFDLPAPNGTCYLADTLEGALLEKLLRTPKRIIVAEQLDPLFHATIAVRRLPLTADLTNKAVSSIGINGEIHAGLDYTTPRAWAAALRKAGWRALRYALRGDPELKQRGLALFGTAGLHRRAPAGFRTSITRLDRLAAGQILEGRGIAVHPIPRAEDLPIVPPPVPPR